MKEEKLLELVKKLPPSTPGQIRLYEIFEFNGSRITPSSLEWRFYAGMGDTGAQALRDDAYETAKSLLRKGDLVRTFEEGSWKKSRKIEVFEDVKFARGEDGEILAYEFMPSHVMPEHPQKLGWVHRNAVMRINGMIENGRALVDAPLRLNRGRIIRPIIMKTSSITDEDMAEIRRRQIDYNPL